MMMLRYLLAVCCSLVASVRVGDHQEVGDHEEIVDHEFDHTETSPEDHVCDRFGAVPNETAIQKTLGGGALKLGKMMGLLKSSGKIVQDAIKKAVCKCPPGTTYKVQSSQKVKFMQSVGMIKESCKQLNGNTAGDGIFNLEEAMRAESKGVICKCVNDADCSNVMRDGAVLEKVDRAGGQTLTCKDFVGQKENIGLAGIKFVQQCAQACLDMPLCQWDGGNLACESA